MPTSRKRLRHQKAPNAALLPKFLSELRVPRCCICDLDWFESEDDLLIPDVTSDECLLLKCKKLVPLPHCKCSTTLLRGSVEKLQDSLKTSSKELKHILNQATQMEEVQIEQLLINKFCFEDNLKEYKKKAMCQDCIEPFVSTAKDVIEHDYKSETQPNIKFSVGGKCTCCRTKFSARSLSALVGEGKKSKDYDNEMREWVQNVKTTIQFVGFTKKLKSILGAKKIGYKDSKVDNEIDVSSHKKFMEKWLNDNEEYSSDECFSDFCGEDFKATNTFHAKKNSKTHVAPAKGEIMQDLMKKDPKFRQEHEDHEFIQKMSKTEEGRRILGIEEPLKRQSEEEIEKDARLAREMTNREGANRKKHALKKSPILDYFDKVKDVTRPKWSSMRKALKKQNPTDGCIQNFMIQKETEECRKKQNYSNEVNDATIDISDSDSDSDSSNHSTHDGSLSSTRFSSSPMTSCGEKEENKMCGSSRISSKYTPKKIRKFSPEIRKPENCSDILISDEEYANVRYNGGRLKNSMNKILDSDFKNCDTSTRNGSSSLHLISRRKEEENTAKLPCALFEKRNQPVEGTKQKNGQGSFNQKKTHQFKFQRLLEMGFDYNECMEAMEQAGNVPDLAINILLSKK